MIEANSPIRDEMKKISKIQDEMKEISTIRDEIINFCNNIKDILLTKNEEYGNSALNPIRLFGTADRIE